MKIRLAAFAGTVRRFVLRGWLVKMHSASDGWWVTDSAGYRHYLRLALCKLVAPDGMVAWRITVGRLNIEFGNPNQQNAKHHARPEAKRKDVA